MISKLKMTTIKTMLINTTVIVLLITDLLVDRLVRIDAARHVNTFACTASRHSQDTTYTNALR